jgi:hypothetical protein
MRELASNTTIKKKKELTRQLCVIVQAILERLETVNAWHSDTVHKQARHTHGSNSERMVHD